MVKRELRLAKTLTCDDVDELWEVEVDRGLVRSEIEDRLEGRGGAGTGDFGDSCLISRSSVV